jgi:hypothetical protein
LDAMRPVVDPGPARLDELTGRDYRGVADDGDCITLSPGFDPQHAEAVLDVVKRHPVDQSGQNLSWRARLCWLRHPGMMNREI